MILFVSYREGQVLLTFVQSPNNDPTGLVADDAQLGYIVENIVQPQYAAAHLGQIVMFGTQLKGFRSIVKPDIQNLSSLQWLDIKPLTKRGVADAVTSYGKYIVQLGPLGWEPDTEWQPFTHTVFIPERNEFYIIYNVFGIVFYHVEDLETDKNILQAIALGSFGLAIAQLRYGIGVRRFPPFGVVGRSIEFAKLGLRASQNRLQGAVAKATLVSAHGIP